VPSLNEGANLLRLLPQLCDALGRLVPRWEVIVVDDGSTDDTVRMLREWWQDRQGVRVLQLARNFGKEPALSAGLQAARGDVVLLMDADLQHPIALLPAFIDRWQRGADVAYAVRQHRADEVPIKRWGARLFYRLLNAQERFEVPAGAGDFRLMDRAVVDALLALPERNRFMKGLYAWVGFDAVAVPYQPDPRASGQSRFDLWRLLRLSIDGLTAFTTWPLRALSLTGTALALAGFAYGGYEAASYLLFGNPVSGWTTIVVALMVFSGVQMISLGIVGEYIGRIFEEVKARPLFVVKRELGQGLQPRAP
jgi:glycosyltransferase involved in cell wall biosynthesis